jgi:hypothetical protein
VPPDWLPPVPPDWLPLVPPDWLPPVPPDWLPLVPPDWLPPVPPEPPDVCWQPQEQMPRIATSNSSFEKFLVLIEAWLLACE